MFQLRSIPRSRNSTLLSHRNMSFCFLSILFPAPEMYNCTSLKVEKSEIIEYFLSIILILPILKIHWHFISIPAGHISVLQSCCSMDSPLHSPPFLSGATNLRVRNWIPPSQLWLQVDQSLHEPQMQSAVWIWKYNINHINSNMPQKIKSHIFGCIVKTMFDTCLKDNSRCCSLFLLSFPQYIHLLHPPRVLKSFSFATAYLRRKFWCSW